MLATIAAGIEATKRSGFKYVVLLDKYAYNAPKDIKAISDLRPLQISPTTKVQLLKNILLPSCMTMIPIASMIFTAHIAAKSFILRLNPAIKESGNGMSVMRNSIGKNNFVPIFLPKREKMIPKRTKIKENPDKKCMRMKALKICKIIPEIKSMKPHFEEMYSIL